jgi:hypothetical protein
MIEQIMFLGIGFLAACLLTLTFIPLVHARAVRLTTRRYQDAMPLSVTEMEAEKDQLRASFAMSIRRLEIALEERRVKAATCLTEIGKKTDEIRVLKTQLGKAAADHLCELAKQSEENQNLKIELGKLNALYAHEIAGQSEENHSGNTNLQKEMTPFLTIKVAEPKRSAYFSFRKAPVKWAASAGATILLVGSLLLGPSSDSRDQRARTAFVIGGDRTAPAPSGKFAVAKGTVGQADPPMREAEAFPRNTANIVIIRGGRRRDSKPH